MPETGFGPNWILKAILKRSIVCEISILEVADPKRKGSKPDWLKFIRRESTERDITVLSLRLEYIPHSRQNVRQMPTNVCASYCNRNKRFSISREDPNMGPGGYISVDPAFMRGKRLGSFLMWNVVSWGQQRCPEYRVNHLMLNNTDQNTDDRPARDGLYAGTGVPLDDQAPAVAVGALTAPTSWMQTIKIHDHTDWLIDAVATKEKLQRTKSELEAAHNRFKQYREHGILKRLFG